VVFFFFFFFLVADKHMQQKYKPRALSIYSDEDYNVEKSGGSVREIRLFGARYTYNKL
jgi:hypothetical protein